MPRIFSQDDGFSLLELLVAIAILSLAVLPMVASQSTAVRSSSILSEKGYAKIVAENVMTELTLSEQPPLAGTIEGEEEFAGIPYHWRATVREISSQSVTSITLTILAANNETELYELTGFRRAI